MQNSNDFVTNVKEKILSDTASCNFNELALDVFQWQAKHVPVYRRYIQALGVDIGSVDTLEKIPFLPIQFFKTHKVQAYGNQALLVFESSGTTGSTASKHYVADAEFASSVSQKIFESFYGALSDYTIFALLPSYLERGNSSLVFMVNHFMQYATKESGFYLNNLSELETHLARADQQKRKVLLIGVTFAMLDLAEKKALVSENASVMETGGMKGRRKEMVRSEVHEILKQGLKITSVHSEYGMTELSSQAYSKGNGIFEHPSWMMPLVREVSDPFSVKREGSGGLNIIDLANITSCAFIETQDVAKVHANSTFEILGRYDNSDVRGCNLMVQ